MICFVTDVCPSGIVITTSIGTTLSSSNIKVLTKLTVVSRITGVLFVTTTLAITLPDIIVTSIERSNTNIGVDGVGVGVLVGVTVGVTLGVGVGSCVVVVVTISNVKSSTSQKSSPQSGQSGLNILNLSFNTLKLCLTSSPLNGSTYILNCDIAPSKVPPNSFSNKIFVVNPENVVPLNVDVGNDSGSCV